MPVKSAQSRIGGSALIVGGADSAPRTLASLVAHTHGFRICTPRTSSAYRERHFIADLKAAMQLVAVEGEPAIFIIEDYQLFEPSFMQIAAAVLGAGSMPRLFTSQEFEPLFAQLHDAATREGFSGSVETFFANRKLSFFFLVI